MNDEYDDTEDGERPIDPSALAENEFAVFGNVRIAYIRPVSFKGEEAFAVHSADGLTLANKVLDYLDLNVNAVLEEAELLLCIEIMELFARADSDNDTLSAVELEMLYATLRYLDTNNNGRLDHHERERLHQGLQNPKAFLAEQRAKNPLFR